MKTPVHKRAAPRTATQGFSLIELMVASTVGLIVTLAVTGSVLSMGRQFSIVGSNVAAQGNAQVALSVLDAAGRAAGAGFYNNGRLICANWNAWNGTTLVSDGGVFMPARIVGGGSITASDTLMFTGGGGTGALSAVPVMEPALGANIKVSEAGGMALNDVAVVGVPGAAQPCTLIQLTAAPAASASGCGGNATTCEVLIRNANQGLNPGPSDFSSNPTYGFTSAGGTIGPSVVSRVGSSASGFRQDAFAVQCNAMVRYNAFMSAAVPACTNVPLGFGAGVDAIASDVVLMHAQYGVSSSGSSDIVTEWVEPTGATWGGTPTAANVARIKAVRVVVVARSKEADNTQVSAACTSPAGVVNTGPCSFQDAAAPVIDLSATSVVAGKTWRNYRYRVHQAVIPLRNVIWSDS